MSDTETPQSATILRTVRFWDHHWEFLESRDLEIEYRHDGAVVCLAVALRDELAQKIFESIFEGESYGAYISIDVDGTTWRGRFAQACSAHAPSGERIAELKYIDLAYKSEFVQLLEAL